MLYIGLRTISVSGIGWSPPQTPAKKIYEVQVTIA